MLLDVNLNSIAQVNHGTGGDVSDESMADADGPLIVRWHTDSYVTVPFDRCDDQCARAERTAAGSSKVESGTSSQVTAVMRNTETEPPSREVLFAGMSTPPKSR